MKLSPGVLDVVELIQQPSFRMMQPVVVVAGDDTGSSRPDVSERGRPV